MRTIVIIISNIITIMTIIIQLPISLIVLLHYQLRGQSSSSASDPLRYHSHRQPYDLSSHEMRIMIMMMMMMIIIIILIQEVWMICFWDQRTSNLYYKRLMIVTMTMIISMIQKVKIMVMMIKVY